jgi:hypothetical protein|tara:strand:- start:693 stop:857 length:165 start_codon:yes stop_codon:yes gene_type:complete
MNSLAEKSTAQNPVSMEAENILEFNRRVFNSAESYQLLINKQGGFIKIKFEIAN